MKVIGQAGNRSVILSASGEEWDYLQRAAGIPYDKKKSDPGTEIDLAAIKVTCEALYDMKEIRKELAAVQKRYDKLATAIDQAMER